MKKRLALTTAICALCTMTTISAAVRSYTYGQMSINDYTATCSLSRGEGHATAITSVNVLESNSSVSGLFQEGYRSNATGWNYNTTKAIAYVRGTPTEVKGIHIIRGYNEQKSLSTFI